MSERTSIFIAYCFPEKRWLDRVQAELDLTVGSGRCTVWDERKLKAGAMWKAELPEVLAGAKVAMMIVSDLFLESEFVTRAKLPALLEMERRNGLEICWVLASHCLFELAGLKEADAGNRLSAALDGLGSAQRDAEAAAIARKVAALLGIAPQASAAKAEAAPAAAPASKQSRKKRKDFTEQKTAGPENAPPPAAPMVTPELPPAPPAPAPAPAPVPPPPAAASPAKSEPEPPSQPPAPLPEKPLPAEPAPMPPPPVATAAPSPAKPLPAATTPLGLEPAPAPAAIATLTHSLEATIQIRQATVLKLSRLARWLLVAAGALALAALVAAIVESFTHFLLVAGFAALVAGLALRLHARSRSLGQGLVGMRYTRSGLADETLLSRQREALMRKAEEYLAQN